MIKLIEFELSVLIIPRSFVFLFITFYLIYIYIFVLFFFFSIVVESIVVTKCDHAWENLRIIFKIITDIFVHNCTDDLASDKKNGITFKLLVYEKLSLKI